MYLGLLHGAKNVRIGKTKVKQFYGDHLINNTDAKKRFRVKEMLDMSTGTLMMALGQVALEEQ